MRISAFLIVKNEEDHLVACLESIRGAVDEIVITDTGSSDGTVAIAQQFTPHVSHFAWVDDFAEARNFALQHVTGDYVLHIDADDIVCDPARAREQLEAFVLANDPDVVGTVAIESAIGQGPETQRAVEIALRFFKRGQFRYVGPIHEQLVPLIGQKRAAPTGVRYIHSGYQFDAASAKNRAHRNKEILRRVLEREPNDEYYLYQLGKAHFGLNEYADAVRCFERSLACIRFSPGAPSQGSSGVFVAEPVLSELLCSLAYAYVNTGATGRARELLEHHAALAHGGTKSADFHHALGYVYLVEGDIARAKSSYFESLRIGSTGERVSGTGSFSSEYHLGLLAEAERDLDRAIEHYRRSIVSKPDYGITLTRCVDLVREYHVALPSLLWDSADHEALMRIYRERLFAALRKDGAAGAAELLNAARVLSPELYRACAVWLREFLEQPT